jgi:PAS domain S-box-containing protein
LLETYHKSIRAKALTDGIGGLYSQLEETLRNSEEGFEANPGIMSEEKLKLLEFSIDNISDAVYWVTLDGRFWNVNAAACKMLGYSREELLTMSVHDIDPTYDPADAQSDFEKVKRTGSIRLARFHHTMDGRVLPVEINSNYFIFNGIEYLCAVARDITDRKRMGDELQRANDELEKRVEERTLALRNANELLQHEINERKRTEDQLKQKKKMLEELNSTLEKRVHEEVSKNREKDIMLIQQNRQAALGELLDHITHQWKQPLNSISLIIQNLKESWSCGDLTDESVEEAVGNTMALVQHMAQTIVVFRNFYRPEKEQAVFRLKDSINSALSFMAPALRFHGIGVEIDADPDLSAIGYPNEYVQVLLNILTNARDAFKERKVHKPVLKIEAFAENDKAVVAITDNAGGIPKSIIGKIFDLYFTTRESKNGTGIGLYMSKNIIEKNMGGKLSAANVDGGTQFRIEINMPG